MGLLNRNFTRDWQHLRESGSGYDLSRATGGESAIRCWRLKCCPIDLRQTWFRSSTIIQQIELYVALCGTTFPEKLHNCRPLSTGLTELTSKILHLFNPTGFIACLRFALVCNTISKNLYSIVYAIAKQAIKLTRKSLWFQLRRLRHLIGGSPWSVQDTHFIT